VQAQAHAAQPSDYVIEASAAELPGTGVPATDVSSAAVPGNAGIADATVAQRPLTILGVTPGGDRVVCGEAASRPEDDRSGAARQTFTIAIDDRLRAAVSGSLGQVVDGQREIEMASQLRPKEIQSRIRAGASVEQVAAAAGCPTDRIEGYAYPVLLERATIAERGRGAQPLAGDARTLEEIALETLADRGQHQSVEWDAFKDERGWTVTLTWQAGRSENRAEWAYVARAVGASLTARNATATDLLEPAYTPPRAAPTAPTGYDVILGAGSAPRAEARGDRAGHAEAGRPEHSGAAQGGADGGFAVGRPAAGSDANATREAAEHRAAPAAGKRPDQPSGSPRGGSKRGHRPQMPSWEDVLLGTRTSDH
jgi:hypothetical protein